MAFTLYELGLSELILRTFLIYEDLGVRHHPATPKSGLSGGADSLDGGPGKLTSFA